MESDFIHHICFRGLIKQPNFHSFKTMNRIRIVLIFFLLGYMGQKVSSQDDQLISGYYIDDKGQKQEGKLVVLKGRKKIEFIAKNESNKSVIHFPFIQEIHDGKNHFLIIPDSINSTIDYMLVEQVIEGEADFYRTKNLFDNDVFFIKRDDKLIKINGINPGSTLLVLLGDCDGMLETKLKSPRSVSHNFKDIYNIVSAFNRCKGGEQIVLIEKQKRVFEFGVQVNPFNGKISFPFANSDAIEALDNRTYTSTGLGVSFNFKTSKIILLETGFLYTKRSASDELVSVQNGVQTVLLNVDYVHFPARLLLRKKINLIDFQLFSGLSISFPLRDNILSLDNVEVENFSAMGLRFEVGGEIGISISKDLRLGVGIEKGRINSTTSPGTGRLRQTIILNENYLKISISKRFNSSIYN